jgi:hypothetical protein
MLTLKISAQAMSFIEGSSISNDPVEYDGGSPAAVDAAKALSGATRKKFGRGYTYEVETTPEGAALIAEFCRLNGDLFAAEEEAETKREGRVLLTAAKRIRFQVEAQKS